MKTATKEGLIVKNEVIKVKTKGFLDFNDITEEVVNFVKKSGITNGICNIQTLHTTTSVIVNENEPLLLEDMKEHFQECVKKDKYYKHNDFTIRTVNMVCDGECKNGHSHCLAAHFPTSVTLNVIEGKLQVGTWQRIFFVELDHERQRQYQFQVIGE